MSLGIQDENLEHSNNTHKHFIETLVSAFEVLGGEQWLSSESQKRQETFGSTKEVENVIFTNPFLSLPVHHIDDETSESTKCDTPEVPIKDYCVTDGPDESKEYAVTVFMVFVEGKRLRELMENYWKSVVHSQLNIAVAGVMSNMAVALVKSTASAIFVESDSRGGSGDSYIDLIMGFTSGEFDRADELVQARGGVSFRESFSLHIFNYLVEFVTDYQTNRTGKPTKRLQADLDKWDPICNLRELSPDERLHWRRLYILNWLYDLVNVFSHIIRHENGVGRDPPETITWSLKGPYRRDARLFGLEDFASSVTTWAMQKPGTKFQRKILLHHVFQLHCIADSFTTSCGWSPNHRFLDRHTDGDSVGFVRGAKSLLNAIQHTPSLSRFAHRNNILQELEFLLTQFETWLGVSDHAFDAENGPPSHFEQEHNTRESSRNGLWRYSPFLCAVGLAEALDVAYRISIIVWNELVEPVQLCKMHTILADKGYLAQELDRFVDLDIMFTRKAFHKATAPTEHPNVLLYQEFDWKFWCIPEEKIIPSSTLGALRIARTKRTIHPETGKMRFEDTERYSEVVVSGMVTAAKHLEKHHTPAASLGYKDITASSQGLGVSIDKDAMLSTFHLWGLLQADVFDDICGRHPLCGFNYLWLAAIMLATWAKIEDKLEKLQSPLYTAISGMNQGLRRLILMKQIRDCSSPDHKRCAETIAQVLQSINVFKANCTYWAGFYCFVCGKENCNGEDCINQSDELESNEG
ncbi:unnamed protein product [Aureobasidium mustum]|uniref:DUF6604 domain-containing protein n=1 Tax=Aureobasidium mustum TaxID=2773714 RepID=A0A9N8P8W1_9PEZI|nr:unnamed protein product [Aureobasidium mustum]